MYLNEYEIAERVRRYQDHAILGPATRTLANLADWTNQNSDGWAYWPKPCRAARRLQELIDGGDRFDHERDDVTMADYRKALAPIKAFRSRQGADFEVVEVGSDG